MELHNKAEFDLYSEMIKLDQDRPPIIRTIPFLNDEVPDFLKVLDEFDSQPPDEIVIA